MSLLKNLYIMLKIKIRLIKKVGDDIKNLYYRICCWLAQIKEAIYRKLYIFRHPDYVEDGNHFGSLEFVWGVKSFDDLSSNAANLYTMNDIDIIYDKTKKIYNLGVETAYLFENKQDECDYIQNCLVELTKFMDENGYDKNADYPLFMSNLTIEADNIPELYTQFRAFAEGLKAISK